MDLQGLFAEMVDQLETLAEQDASEARVAWFQKQHKGSKLRCYGIRTPQVRKLIRKHSPLFHQLSLEEKFRLAIMFYRSGVFEQATVGDALLELGSEDISPDAFDALDEVVGHFHNWASVDQLCLHTMQPLLRMSREETLELLRKWNHSENLWKRRASVVSFVRNIGKSGDFLEEVLEFCENLIWDKEDLVLKGVGWALRDSMNGDKTRVIEYVKSLRRRGVPSRVTLYAIEHLKGKERNAILKAKPQEQRNRK
jgi:3-methyladenine DNA glycosylase AlkD